MATMQLRQGDAEDFRPVRNNFQYGPVVTIVIVLLTWLISASITYGILSAKISQLEDRVSILEKNQLDMLQHNLTRDEFQRYNASLENKMDDISKRMQDKLEQIIREQRGRR